MKNNLLGLKSFDVDSRLPTQNDFLDFVIADKMDEGEIVDVLNQITNVFDFVYENDDDYDPEEEEEEEYLYERLKNEMSTEESSESHSNHLLYAGYSDCMDEAIRFLIEEENISPEHPVVKNLRAHLEKSKERILQTFSREDEAQTQVTSQIFPLDSVFTDSFQSCRDSG